MCGISGISFKGSDSEINISKIAKEMNRALIHRGPDDSNHWKNISNSLVFSHRRLSILDISKNGLNQWLVKVKDILFALMEKYIITYYLEKRLIKFFLIDFLGKAIQILKHY